MSNLQLVYPPDNAQDSSNDSTPVCTPVAAPTTPEEPREQGELITGDQLWGLRELVIDLGLEAALDGFRPASCDGWTEVDDAMS